MTLKKPSDYFNKNNPTVSESVQINNTEVLSEFSNTLNNYRANIERVDHLSSEIKDIKNEVETLLRKEDLDNALVSQLLVVDEIVADIQRKVKSINEKKLTDIRLEVSTLSESVNNFIEVDVPKYKKLVVDSEIRTTDRYEELEENVSHALETIGEFVDAKYQELTESLQGINEQNLAEILEDFKVLEGSIKNFKEKDIPKYKGFIVETEIKTESKLKEFQESLDETLSNIIEKVNLVEGDKENLVNIINEKVDEVKSLVSQVNITEQNIQTQKDFIKKRVADLEVDILRNENHIKVQNENLKTIQEEVKESLTRINLEEIEKQNHRLGEKIKYLDEVFDKFSEKEILTENIITELPSTNNTDPLTPLDQNFVTLDQLQQHYRLFINRIQQQLSSIGGGGETRLEFLDDVDRDSAKTDGKFLKYDSSTGKWIGGDAGSSLTVTEVPSQGGAATTSVNNVTEIQFNNGAGFSVSDEGSGVAFVDLGSTFNPWYVDGQDVLKATGEEPIEFIAGAGIAITTKAVASVGIGTTFSKAITISSNLASSPWVDANPGIYTTGNVAIGTDTVGSGSTALWVEGDARITGILSVGQGTITIDGTTNTINVENLSVTNSISGSGASLFQNNVSIAGTVGIGTRIDIVPYDTLSDGTLSFEGSASQLFSITNNLTTGSIFSVNDVSGIPSIDVDADGTIQLAPYGITEYVGIGTTNPTAKLDVVGDAKVSGIVTASGGFNLGISSAGTSITSGPVTTLNFIGAGNTFAINGTTVDVSIAGGGGAETVPTIYDEETISNDSGWQGNTTYSCCMRTAGGKKGNTFFFARLEQNSSITDTRLRVYPFTVNRSTGAITWGSASNVWYNSSGSGHSTTFWTGPDGTGAVFAGGHNQYPGYSSHVFGYSKFIVNANGTLTDNSAVYTNADHGYNGVYYSLPTSISTGYFSSAGYNANASSRAYFRQHYMNGSSISVGSLTNLGSDTSTSYNVGFIAQPGVYQSGNQVASMVYYRINSANYRLRVTAANGNSADTTVSNWDSGALAFQMTNGDVILYSSAHTVMRFTAYNSKTDLTTANALPGSTGQFGSFMNFGLGNNEFVLSLSSSSPFTFGFPLIKATLNSTTGFSISGVSPVINPVVALGVNSSYTGMFPLYANDNDANPDKLLIASHDSNLIRVKVIDFPTFTEA